MRQRAVETQPERHRLPAEEARLAGYDLVRLRQQGGPAIFTEQLQQRIPVRERQERLEGCRAFHRGPGSDPPVVTRRQAEAVQDIERYRLETELDEGLESRKRGEGHVRQSGSSRPG